MAIRYPTNYDSVADIPADLEDMADSIQDELDLKVDKVTGKGLSTEDYTTAEKTKLAGIEAQANKTVVDSSLDSSSTNPVQNKKVKEALDEKQAEIDALNTYTKKLEKQIPTGTASGSSVQLTDSAESLAIDNVEIGGATGQAQYEGYNLLPNNVTSQTINGITITVNEDKSITAKGTASTTFLLEIGTFTFLANTTYRVSGCPSGGTDNTYRIDYRTAQEAVSFTDYGSGGTVTKTADTTLTAKIRIASGAVLNNILFKPMIVQGSTEKTYEPYCGKKASPNPDFPQAIHKVTGNCNVKMHNKNFFNKTSTTFTSSKTLDTSTGELVSASNDWAVSDFIPIYKTKNAVLSGKIVPQGWNVRICTYDRNKTFIHGEAIANTNNIFSITTTEDFYYVRFAKNSANFDADTVQLELGTTSTSYQDFVENLYNSSTNTTGKYLTEAGLPSSVSGWNTSDYIPVKAQKIYTYSGLTSVGTAPYSCYYDSNKTFVSSFKQAVGENTITIPDNICYVRFSIATANINTFSIVKENQAPLTLGDIELYDGDKIQISYVNEAGYKKVTGANIVNNMAKVVLNGTEAWQLNDSGTSSYSYRLTLGGQVASQNCLSTHYPYAASINNSNTNQGIVVVNITASNWQIRIRYGTEDTLANFKSLLATEYANETPVEVIYQLATPTTTAITDTTLLSQLETLINMETYKQITNIETEGADLNPVLEFDYSKDLTTIINNLTQAIIEIGGE